LGNVSDSGSLSRYSKSTVRRHRRVSHFEVEFARKLFPTDDSALKVAFLAIQQASKKWTMPIQNWKLALNRFIIEFGDRLNGHL
ncbi:MAG: hypothetical protein E7I01_21420, partial [Aeromonas sp.]|nr:hypothetical protein [Aeromonas sp.]